MGMNIRCSLAWLLLLAFAEESKAHRTSASVEERGLVEVEDRRSPIKSGYITPYSISSLVERNVKPSSHRRRSKGVKKPAKKKSAKKGKKGTPTRAKASRT